jgi:hypothetical protein
MGPPDRENRKPREPPQRTPSVSERIASRLREIQKRSADKATEAEPAGEDEKRTEATTTTEPEKAPPSAEEKGKGRAIVAEPESTLPASPPPMSPPLPPAKLGPPPLNTNIARGASPMPPAPPSPIVLGGLSLPPSAVSALLARAKDELPLRPIRVPILGEYPECFSGEEFVTWLMESVQAFGSSWDKAEEAARQLAEEQGLLRRIGEIGNQFEAADDAYYQFRPKVSDCQSGFSMKRKCSHPIIGGLGVRAWRDDNAC